MHMPSTAYTFSAAKYEIHEVQQSVTLQLVSAMTAEEEHSLLVHLKNGSAMCEYTSTCYVLTWRSVSTA